MSHSTELCGGACHYSSKASRRENLEIEQPVACRDFSSFDFHTALPSMLGATLIRNEVVQVGEPREKRLLAPTWMMEPLHREEFPLDSVMRLIEQRTGHGHLRVGEYRVPARLLVLCQEGWPLRQQDWPFGLPEPQGGQRQVCREEETAWDDRSI